MLLSYKRDRLQLLLIISLICCLFGVINLVVFMKNESSSLFLSLLYVIQAGIFYSLYKYLKIKKYLYICNEYIQRNSLFISKAYLDDILKVRKRGKVYFFYTPKKTLKVNTKLLDGYDKEQLDIFISKLPISLTI